MTDSAGLVVVEDPDRDRALLEQARAFAVGRDGDLVVLALATRDEYEQIADTLETIGRAENTSYDSTDVADAVTGNVADAADDVLGESVAYDVRAAVADGDEQADRILDAAESAGCDHVFVSGRRRSPTGKAVFGDRTQRVLLEFGGHVTVSMS
jgi:nucleotide-binding universal stress UspA family protein